MDFWHFITPLTWQWLLKGETLGDWGLMIRINQSGVAKGTF
jgi:hypothetical protein